MKRQEQARCNVWWPRISRDIQEIVSTCEHHPLRKENILSLLRYPVAHRKEYQLICELNEQNYLVVVDFFRFLKV